MVKRCHEGFALLLTGRYQAGGATQALIVGPEGELAQTMELSGQILGLSAAGGYCALLTGSELAIYTRELAPYATLTTTQGARLVSLSPNGSALLANDEQAWLYIPD